MLRPSFPLLTERLLLRPFSLADLDAYARYQSQEGVVRYLYWGVRTREEIAEALRRRTELTEICRERDVLALAVERRDAPGLIGDVILAWTSAANRTGEVGFVFDPAHQGRGYATEAAREMLRLGFEDLGLKRIVGRLDARNDASARTLERLGMRREAHFVENEWVKEEWTSEVVYAILDHEWRATRP